MRRHVVRLGIAMAVAGMALAGAGAASAATFVDVAAATVWTSPAKPRGIDAPALARPVRLDAWLDNLTTADRRALTARNATQTQALYGRRVHVLARAPGWVRVAVPGQPTPKDARGYPGWVPAAQLTRSRWYAARAHGRFAQVDGKRTTWLYRDARLRRRALRIGFGTRLPVLVRRGKAIRLATPDGPRWIAARAVSLHRSASDFARPTGADLVRTAETFLGADYLWAGRSAWMVDCSGLTGLVYEAHGITIGRDTSVQARSSGGTRVATGADRTTAGLRPGDLLFYGTGAIHHVALYAGGGQMIEAYAAGTAVRRTPVRFGPEYWGAVRFLG